MEEPDPEEEALGAHYGEILVPTLLFATLVAIRVEGGDEVIRTLKRCSKHQSVMRGTVRNIVSFLS